MTERCFHGVAALRGSGGWDPAFRLQPGLDAVADPALDVALHSSARGAGLGAALEGDVLPGQGSPFPACESGAAKIGETRAVTWPVPLGTAANPPA